MPPSSPTRRVCIYFSDFFNVSRTKLDHYGAFNVSLINDLPLFVDPFLLFESSENQYQQLHEDIIQYLMFLREISTRPCSDELVEYYFTFHEVKQNWLGFSLSGNRGSGLGMKFAQSLKRNLVAAFDPEGERITRGFHIEKLCLLNDGVGRDHISDFTTNIIKRFLLEYTQAFAEKYIDPALCRPFTVDRVFFDYEERRWRRAEYKLPCHNRDFVLLTPKDILTKDDTWINRSDMLDDFERICTSLDDSSLRFTVNQHFSGQISKRASDKERREAAARTIQKFPQLVDHFIKDKELNGSDARAASSLKVQQTQEQFVENLSAFIEEHLAPTEFYAPDNSYEAALKRVHFLKHVIENKDGYRVFYADGKPIQRESDLQIMYKFTWFASVHDANSEVNNGRGPADFVISKGAADKAVVEFKLASNSKLADNLQKQAEIYQTAADAQHKIKVILYFHEHEHRRVRETLKTLNMLNAKHIVLIDARADNKPSASRA